MKKKATPTKVKKARAQKVKRTKVRKTASSTKAVKKLLKQTETEGKYTITITLGTEVFTTKADSIVEALSSFKPDRIVLKMILKIVSDDGREFERYLFPRQSRRIFNNEMAMQLFVKGLEQMFK